MAASFFFYDLETSGFGARSARIMQFAGQRTTLDLEPVGEPVNVLIRLTPDVLPDPDAILVTGITPQATLANGVTEADFLRLFCERIATPDTIFAGYNSVRFDDEFMRFLHYRNFYDAYRWQWCDGCSRWDLLDVVRMTRGLRPVGIKWPFAPDGTPSNRLALLTSHNGLSHENAHDAESDVQATIAVARLIKAKQPKLFQFLLDMRDKRKVATLVGEGQPFVYTSGKYAAEHEKTTVAARLADHMNGQGALVYDLRYDPGELDALSVEDIAKRLSWHDHTDPIPPMPVKVMRFNRCPAVAPLNVLDEASKARLKLDMAAVDRNFHKLRDMPDFARRVQTALESLERCYPQAELLANDQAVDGQLYDGFIGDTDRRQMDRLRSAVPEDLVIDNFPFHDQRLSSLFPLYKARNYPEQLTDDEREVWERFCVTRLTEGGSQSRIARYFARVHALSEMPGITRQQRSLLEELRLYGETLMPAGVA